MYQSPSFQNLLISIPSQASSMATTAVGHLLQDQMKDPRQMKKTLKRLGSVVSDWGFGMHGTAVGAGGDIGGFSMEEEAASKIPLLRPPEEFRNKIWSMLDNSDILTLRAVCEEMKKEMDHQYGLRIIMDTSNESMHFMQNVTVRSCLVARLENILHFNFLQQPDKMQHLRFQQDVSLLPEDKLDNILRKFQNLQTILFYNTNFHVYRNGKLKLSDPTETARLLDFVASKLSGRVVGVSLKYNSATDAVKWDLELQPSQAKCMADLGYLHFDMPSAAKQLQLDALAFLNKQCHLFEIRSELVGLSWSCYSEAIQQNSRSLTGLHLLSLKCTEDEPFDFESVSECANLRFLSISGENSFANTNVGGFAFISVVGVKKLYSLKRLCTLSLVKVHLRDNEFSDLKTNMETVSIHMTQLMVGSKEIIEQKFSKAEDYEEGYDEYATFTNIHEPESTTAKQSTVKAFICDGFHPAIIKGLIITTWLAFC